MADTLGAWNLQHYTEKLECYYTGVGGGTRFRKGLLWVPALVLQNSSPSPTRKHKCNRSRHVISNPVNRLIFRIYI